MIDRCGELNDNKTPLLAKLVPELVFVVEGLSKSVTTGVP